MKLYIIMMLISICLILGIIACGQEKTVVIMEDGQQIVTGQPNEHIVITPPNTTITTNNVPPPDVVVVPASRPVRLVFNIRSEFPSGNVRPDRVVMDGTVIAEDTSVTTGAHNFAVEKRGYQSQIQSIVVSDPDQDGLFELSVFLPAKPRLVLFDIRDGKTNEVIMPDQVTIVKLPEGEQQTLSNSVTIQPGRKRIVIQKQKYQTISEDITIDADENPYMLQYQMMPQ